MVAEPHALDNLASVAINTSLISDTTNTDDLGSSGITWRNGYFGTAVYGPAFDTVSAGALSIGTSNANAITIGKTGVTTTLAGTISVSGLSTAGIVTNTAGGVLGTVATLPIANGGTNNTTYTTNGVNYYDGSKIASTAAGSTGQCLLATTAAAPSWGTCPAGSIGGANVSVSGLATNQMLVYNGTNWVNGTSAGDLTNSVSGSTNTFTIANSAITNGKIATGAVNSTSISDGTVTGTDLATSTVTGSNIAATTITASNIANATITTTQIASATITGGNIANATVANANLVNSSITINNGSNITGGGTVSLGGSLTLAVSATPNFTTVTTAGLTNTGYTLLSAQPLSLGSSGAVGAAASTVDVYTTFNITATAGGLTFTLPTPTTATGGRLVYINNVGGSNSFTMYGVTIPISKSQAYIWNGTAWAPANIDGAGSGATTVGAISGTANANGATITGNTLNLTAANGTNGGVLTSAAQTIGGLKTFQNGVTSSAALTVSAGGASITGGLNNNNGGITSAGAISGGTAITSSGTITFSGLSTAGIVTNTAGGVLGTTSSVPVANGGTGATTSQGAINNLSQLTTNGDLLYNNGTNSTRLARGTNGQCLTSTTTSIQWGSCGLSAEADTLATVTGRGATTTTASSFQGGATIRTLTVDTSTATDDLIAVAVTAGGAGRFTGTITNADLTANRTWTLPNVSGTVITTGNLNSITSTGTITSGTWQGTAIGVGYGGTGLTSYTAGDLLYASGTSTLSKLTAVAAGSCLVSNGVGAAPIWSSCSAAAGGANTSLSNLTATSINQNLVADANNTRDIGTSSTTWRAGYFGTSVNTPLLQSNTSLTITPSGTLTAGSTSQVFVLQGTGGSTITANGGGGTTTIGFSGAPVGNVSYNFDRSVAAGSYTICTTVGNCVGSGGGVSTSGGTTNRIAKFSASQAITDSSISDDGSTVTINGSSTLAVQGASVTVGTASLQGSLVLQSGGGYTTTLKAGASSSNLTFLFPTADGSSLQCLKTNGSGQLGFYNCNNGSGSGGAVTLNDAYTAGNTITTTDSRDVAFTFADTTTDASMVFNLQCTTCSASGGRFAVQNGGTDVFTVNPNSGGVLTKLNSTVALAVQNTSGLGQLTVDTTNKIVQVGNAVTDANATLLILDSYNGGSDPAGYNGAMYYNTSTNKLRCYENGAWTDCITTSGPGGANTSLSNLTSTSVNQTLTANASNSLDIGTSGTSWRSGYFGTSIITPTIDTNSAVALNIGTTNATSINLNQNTVVAAGKTVTITGLSTAGIVTNTAGGVLGTTSSVPVANGGTGATTSQGAINNLSQLTTNGDLLYNNGTNSTRLARGTNGQCLTSTTTSIQWGSCGLSAEADTLATVTGRGATTTTASSFQGGATIRTLTVDTSTATDDLIAVAVAAGGASRFTGTITNADLTANRTWTLPNVSGTVITTGNLNSITCTGTITSGTWQGTAIGAAYGGTGLSSYTTGDLLYATGQAPSAN